MMIKYLDLQKVNAQYSTELHDVATKVIDRGWYVQGEEVEKFEEEYAKFIGQKFCISCGNGLDALTLMLRAYMELGVLYSGDEVIVPANTFIATVLSITENNIHPVFVDVNPETLQIDDQLIESVITSRTRAILIVHLYGICSYTERIGDICKKYNLLLLEDNAQAHGAVYKSHTRTGSLGNAAAHSFYPCKNMGSLGDAGAVTTNDAELADVIRHICNYGFSRRYYADYIGRNSRMDEIQAAFLRVKLHHLDEDNKHRQVVAHYYINNIKNNIIRIPRVKSVYHIFTVFCKERDKLQKYLLDKNIETLIHYPVPPHLQKCYSQFNKLSFPVTEQLANEELSLPISPVLTLEEASIVVEAVNSFR